MFAPIFEANIVVGELNKTSACLSVLDSSAYYGKNMEGRGRARVYFQNG